MQTNDSSPVVQSKKTRGREWGVFGEIVYHDKKTEKKAVQWFQPSPPLKIYDASLIQP